MALHSSSHRSFRVPLAESWYSFGIALSIILGNWTWRYSNSSSLYLLAGRLAIQLPIACFPNAPVFGYPSPSLPLPLAAVAQWSLSSDQQEMQNLGLTSPSIGWRPQILPAGLVPLRSGDAESCSAGSCRYPFYWLSDGI
jgi:hypothetical protein